MSIENRVFIKVQQKTFTLYSNVKMRPQTIFLATLTNIFAALDSLNKALLDLKFKFFKFSTLHR